MDYLSMTREEQRDLEHLFAEWIKWFIDYTGIDETEEIYVSDTGKIYTIADYVRVVKSVFGFQAACKEYMTYTYSVGGKEATIDYIKGMMDLVSAFDCEK